MANVVRLKVKPVQDLDIATLCGRLADLEGASSPDEATMDAIAEAEQTVLQALVRTRCGSLVELAQKIAAISRRAQAADGFLGEGELAVLDSVTEELRHFGRAVAFG